MGLTIAASLETADRKVSSLYIIWDLGPSTKKFGSMSCIYAPNLRKSKLYNTLKGTHGDEFALNTWLSVRTDAFKQVFGEWEAKALVKDNKSSDYGKALVDGFYYESSRIVDDNNEPLPLYVTEDKSAYLVTSSKPSGTNKTFVFSNAKKVAELPTNRPSLNFRDVRELIYEGYQVATIGDKHYILDKSTIIGINNDGVTPDSSPYDSSLNTSTKLIRVLDKLSTKFGVKYKLDTTMKEKGMVLGNTVYVNPLKANANTAIHEYGHFLVETIRINRPDLYQRLHAEMLTTRVGVDTLKQVEKEYPLGHRGSLTRDNQLDEALVRVVSKVASDRLKTPDTKNLWDLIKEMFTYISRLLNITNTVGVEHLSPDVTLNELADLLIDDSIFTGAERVRFSREMLEKEEEDREDETNKWTLDERVISLQAFGRTVKFDDSPLRKDDVLQKDNYSNTWKRNHNYTIGGEKFDISTTQLVHEFEEFSITSYLTNNTRGTTIAGKHMFDYMDDKGVYLPRDIFLHYMENPLDHEIWTETWEKYVEDAKEQYSKDLEQARGTDQEEKLSKMIVDDKELKDKFKQFFYLFRSWGRHRESGSNLHMVIEAILTEDEDIEANPRALAFRRRIEQLREKEEDELEDYQLQIIKVADKIAKIKEYVHSQGGKIITEPILYARPGDYPGSGAISLTGEVVSMAGRPDAVAVYPDATAEIYDLKTMMWPVPNEPGLYQIVRGSQRGYSTWKQEKHAKQMHSYARIIETDPRIKIDRVKGVYIIPLHVEEVTDTAKKGSPTSKLVPSKINIHEFDIHNSRVTQEMHDQGVDFIVNTEAFGDGGRIHRSAKLFARSKVNSSMRTNYELRRDEELAREEESYYKVDEEFREMYLDKNLEDAITKIRVYIKQTIEDLRAGERTDKASIMSSKLRELNSNLDALEKVEGIYNYVNYIHSVLFEGQEGYDRYNESIIVPPLQESIENIRTQFEDNMFDSTDSGENLRLAIQRIDDLRRELKSHAIIDDVIGVLENAPTEELNRIKETTAYKKMKEVQSYRTTALNNLDTLGMDLIASWLVNYNNKELNYDLERHFKSVLRRKKEDLKRYSDVYNSTATDSQRDNMQSKIKNLEKQIKSIEEKMNKMMVNKATVKKNLYQLDEDISAIFRWAVSATASNDEIIGLFTVALKNQLNEADANTQKGIIKINKIFEDYVKPLVKLNSSKYSTSNMDGIMKEILEEIDILKFNRDTGKHELTKRWAFIAPYKLDYLTEYRKIQLQLESMRSADGYILDDNLDPILDEDGDPKVATLKDIRDKRREIVDWKFNNLEKEYIPEYYEYEKVLIREEGDPLYEAANRLKQELDTITDNIYTILDEPDEFEESSTRYKILTSEEEKALEKLNLQKRQLASLKHLDGTEKTGIEKQMALLMRDRQRLFNEVHEFGIDTDKYNNFRSIAAQKLKSKYSDMLEVEGNVIPEWQARLRIWEYKNSDVVLTDEFKTLVDSLFKNKKVIEFIDSLEGREPAEWVSRFRNDVISAFATPDPKEALDRLDEIMASGDYVKDLNERWSTFSDNYEEINNMIRPYIIREERYDGSYIEDNYEFSEKLKSLERNTTPYRARNPRNKEILKSINERIRSTVDWIPTPEYLDALEKAKQLIGTKNSKGHVIHRVEQTDWYKANHYTVTVGRGDYAREEVRELRIWRMRVPSGVGLKYKKNIYNVKHEYYIERELEKKRIEELFQESTKEGFILNEQDGYDGARASVDSDDAIYNTDWYIDLVNEKLKDTAWFKKAHLFVDGNVVLDDENHPKVSNKYITYLVPSDTNLIDIEKNRFYKIQPSYKYRNAKPKKEYIRSEEELSRVKDNRDRFKPLMSKWANPKYEQLMARTDEEGVLLKNIHNSLLELYLDDQELFTDKRHRLGYLIPGERKNTMDMMFNEKGNLDRKGIKAAIAERSKSNLFTVSDDIEEDKPHEGVVARNDFDFKPLRSLIPTNTEAKDTELNLFRTLQIHKSKAHRWNAKRKVLPEVRTLMDVLKQRDLDSDRGTKVKDVKGRGIVNRIYREVTGRSIEDPDNKVLSEAKESLQYKMLHDFMEMQIFGETNIPVPVDTWIGSLHDKFGTNPLLSRIRDKADAMSNKSLSFRVDKLSDSMRMLASLTQVGGFYALDTVISMGGLLKGLANWMNAKHQQQVEAHASKFFKLSELRRGGSFFISPPAGRRNVMLEAMEDLGRVAKVTWSGQLQDLFDPVQGNEFVDTMGHRVVGAKLKHMISMNTMFFFQHAGEYQAAMQLMFTMMYAHKVDANGNVYSRQQWINKKLEDKNRDTPEEDWVDLTKEEKSEANIEFDAMKKSLLDVYNIDNESGVLKVDAGVKFGRRDDILESEEWKRLNDASKEELSEEEIERYKQLKVEVDKAQEKFNIFKNRLHEMSHDLNGNYAKFSTPTAKRHFMARLLFQYKDYLIPQWNRRFGKFKRNYHLGTVAYGYHRHFWKLFVSDTRDTIKEMKNALLNLIRKNKHHNPRLSQLEVQNIARSLYEQMTVIAIMMLLSAIEPDDDEVKSEISTARWILLYETIRMRQEISALTPTVPVVGDPFTPLSQNWKALGGPFSLYSHLMKWGNLFDQIGNDISSGEFEEYDRGYGSYIEKGDKKVLIKLRKVLGNLGIFDPKQMYDNFDR